MKILINEKQNKRLDRRWLKGLIREVLKGLNCPEDCEVSILLVDDEGIRELNKRYLRSDRPTDVLSFPMGWGVGKGISPEPTSHIPHPVLLGDVVVSVERATHQAGMRGITLKEEMARLLVHGILHLLGFNHKGGRAKRMGREEKRLMGLLKTSYKERMNYTRSGDG